MDISALTARVDKLLEKATAPSTSPFERANEVFLGAITVLEAIHGPGCEQLKSLQEMANGTIFRSPGNTHVSNSMLTALSGALTNLKSELETELIGSLQKRITGDVLTDFVQLAKASLDEPGDSAKNVAAVLAAAAYEDTIRRMGAAFAGVIGRDDLSDVIDNLKAKGILVAQLPEPRSSCKLGQN